MKSFARICNAFRRARLTRQAADLPPATAQFHPLEGRTLFAAGTLDPTFGTGGKSVLGDNGDNWAESAFDMEALPDNGFVLGVSGIRRDRYDPAEKQTVSELGFGLTFVSPSGALSTRLTSTPDTPLSPNGIAALPDGDVLLVGSNVTFVDRPQVALVRYRGGEFGQPVITDLTPFAAPGYDNAWSEAADAVVLPDGKILVAGTLERQFRESHETRPLTDQPVVLRYNPDLTLDRTFGGGDGAGLGGDWGRVVDLAVGPDGKIVVALNDPRPGLSRAPTDSLAVARFNADGSVDTTFEGNGVAIDSPTELGIGQATAVAVTPDNKVLVAGYWRNDGSRSQDFAVVRLKTDGDNDDSFGLNSRALIDFGGLDDVATSVAVQTNGKILVGGYSGNGATGADLAFARLLPNGAADGANNDDLVKVNFGPDFNDPDADEYGGYLGIQSDGKVVLAGATSGTTSGIAAARFQGDPVPAEQVYQAEAARLSGPTARHDNAGFNGTGYADFTNATGDVVEWSLNASADASHRLTFRYANGSSDRPLELRVNGTVVKRLSFPNTGAWSKWGTVFADVPLQGGGNSIRLTSVGSNGPNVDQVGVKRSPAPAPPPPPREKVYEAENASIVGAEVHRAYLGYSGSGYVDYVHTSGDSIEWTVTADAAATHRLAFRYALGSGVSDRPLELKVNGQVVKSRLSFPGTGSWSVWNTVVFDAPLRVGTNTVRLTTAGSNGPNVDSLTVTPPALPPTSQTLQAEDATLRGPIVGVSNANYTGTGYADFGTAPGESIEWNATVGETRDYVLDIRYANGGDRLRPLNLTVDGAAPPGVTNPLPFGPTGMWAGWRTVSIAMRLTAGTHRIRLESTGPGPNVDALTVRPA